MEDTSNPVEVNAATRKEDYISFYRYYFFRRRLGFRLLYFVLVIGFIASISVTGYKNSHDISESQYSALNAFFMIMLLIIAFTLPYLTSVIRLKKKLAVNNLLIEEKNFTLLADGIQIVSQLENNFWKYSSIKEVEISSEYVHLIMFPRKLYLLPVSSFSGESAAAAFYSAIHLNVRKSKINGDYVDPRKMYYWGLLGFVPILGGISGLVLVIKGLTHYKDRIMVAIGATGVLVTCVFWGFVRPGLMSEQNRDSALSATPGLLNDVVKDIELYKVGKGIYPDSIEWATEADRYISAYDLMSKETDQIKRCYQYHKIGNRYTLYSVGLDGIAGTADDLYPTLGMNDTAKFGLIKAK